MSEGTGGRKGVDAVDKWLSENLQDKNSDWDLVEIG